MRHKFYSHHRGERSSPMRLLIVLGCFGVVYVAILLGIYLVGNRLESAQTVENYGSLDGRFEASTTIDFYGETYEYRANDFENILLIGVDQESISSTTGAVRSGGQADFMVLLSFDKENRKIIPLQLDRDTMTAVQVYGAFGNPAGTRDMQMCLAYAFGDSPEAGCENTVKAVRELLGGIEIDHYMAMDMYGMAALNDALGGITVTLEDDFSEFDPEMVKGATLRLEGQQAEYFLRGRMTVGDGTNEARMKRQRVFMNEAVEVLSSKLEEDVNFVNELLDALAPHLCTNAERGWLINLAYSTSGYQRSDFRTMPGVHVTGSDGFIEFYPNEDSLQALIVTTYCE